ncbi:CCAAT/enhancer-binding protein beta, partial [Ophiophagus hannah]
MVRRNQQQECSTGSCSPLPPPLLRFRTGVSGAGKGRQRGIAGVSSALEGGSPVAEVPLRPRRSPPFAFMQRLVAWDQACHPLQPAAFKSMEAANFYYEADSGGNFEPVCSSGGSSGQDFLSDLFSEQDYKGGGKKHPDYAYISLSRHSHHSGVGQNHKAGPLLGCFPPQMVETKVEP